MRILWLHMENFKCFRNERIPENGILPEGLIFVEGENSVGKTTIFNAIYYALFYEPAKDKGILGTKDMLIKRGEKEAKVELAFEVLNKYYVVQKGHGTSSPMKVHLFQIDEVAAQNGNLKILSKIAEGSEDVNKKLFELLNITRENVLNTLIVNQGEVQQLAEASGAELRDIIYKLFHLDDIREKAKNVIKRKLDKLEEEFENYRIKRTTEDIIQEIEELENEIKEKTAKEEEISEKLEETRHKISQYPQLDELQEINNLITKIEEKERRIENLHKSTKQKASLVHITELSEKTIKEKQLEIKQKIKQNEIEITNLEAKRTKNLKRLHSLQKELENLTIKIKKLENYDLKEQEEFVCDTCEQKLSYEKFRELVERNKRNIPTLESGIKKRENEEKTIKSQIQEKKNINQNLQSLTFSLKNLLEDLSNLDDEKNELEQKRNELKEKILKFGVTTVEELSKKYSVTSFREFFTLVNELNATIARLKSSLIFTKEAITRSEKKIELLKSEIEKNKEREEKQEQIRQKQAAFKDVEGIVLRFIAEELISNRLLAGIQKTTSSNIQLFTRGKYSELYLEATVKKTLKLSIKDEDEDFIKDQEFLSGGDKAAIGLGLRLGISELLKQIRPFKDSPHNPPRMDIMILDEPLGSLDAERRKKVLEGLLVQKKFSQIFLITHTNIREELQAPSIHVKRLEKGSTTRYYPAPSEIEMESEI